MKPQTHKTIVFTLITVGLCAALLGTSTGCSKKQPEPDTDCAVSVEDRLTVYPVDTTSQYQPETSITPESEPTPDPVIIRPAPMAYRGILDMYHCGIGCHWSNRDSERSDDLNDPDSVSFMIPHYYGDSDLSDIGYALIDLNNDGQDELMIGSIDSASGGTVYQLYTIHNGKVKTLIFPTERSNYKLTEDNTIYHDGSGGALCNSRAELYLENGELKTRIGVLYDGYDDEENPYFRIDDQYGIDGSKTPITEAEADSLVNAMAKPTAIRYTPFSQYQ